MRRRVREKLDTLVALAREARSALDLGQDDAARVTLLRARDLLDDALRGVLDVQHPDVEALFAIRRVLARPGPGCSCKVGEPHVTNCVYERTAEAADATGARHHANDREGYCAPECQWARMWRLAQDEARRTVVKAA